MQLQKNYENDAEMVTVRGLLFPLDALYYGLFLILHNV